MLNLFPQAPTPSGPSSSRAVHRLNLRGIRATARTNQVLTAIMGVVIVWTVGAMIRFVFGQVARRLGLHRARSMTPSLFSWRSISNGASIAVLTYIGFDGISTLSEEVKNPRRNILLGTVGTCLIIGILSLVQVYWAQMVWPAATAYPDIDTAYLHIAGRAGGDILFQTLTWILVLATIGSASGAMLAGARLLYGMGRDGALPKGFFGYVHPVRRIPSNNVLLIGCGLRHRRVPDQLPDGRRTAQLRRAHRLYGRQSVVA
jgi:putrescine importer